MCVGVRQLASSQLAVAIPLQWHGAV